jgi:predicted MPP superfamily phosphohydrolase
LDLMLAALVRRLPEVIAFCGVFALHCGVALLWLRRSGRARWKLRTAGLVLLLSASLLMFGFLANTSRGMRFLPYNIALSLRAAGLMWALCSLAVILALLVARLLPKAKASHSPARRKFLLAARGAVLGAPAVAAGYGVFIERSDLRLRTVDVPVRGLPRDLNGLRLVQVSDIHLSPYLTRSELRRAIDMANESRPDIALVTGDLISMVGDPLDDCLQELKRLRAGAGVVGCLGNHEVYTGTSDYITRQGARIGIDFLRSANRVFRFGDASVNIAGVDYQKFHADYLVGAEKLIQPGMPNILLSHNPDVFPVAAAKGFDATISGHTHGGQITAEILDHNISIARFYTRYVYGLYRRGDASVFVTRGIGTVGLPARLGAPPEVALIRLCAT